VPESVPAPNSFICSSGKSERTSFQLSTFEPFCQIFFSSAVVRHSAQSFWGLTTFASPSLATCTSSYFTPSFAQASFSSASIERDASETSVSAAQNFSKPPPVPDTPTVILTSGFSSRKSSAAVSDRGPTVLEPSMLIVPERLPPPPLPPSSPPQAGRTNASPKASRIAGKSKRARTGALLL
jgi:hypothetical protein